jgi:hypothetical protein
MKHPLWSALVFCLLGLAPRLAAADYGLFLNAEGSYVSDPAGKGFGFTSGMRPWFSAALGENAGLYFSARLTAEYEYYSSAWTDPHLIELERTELDMRPLSWLRLNLGRQHYRDGAGMIASGLFDGVSGTISTGPARIFLGALYSGLQYKERVEILMSAEDRRRYHLELDYGDMDSYFASRRLLVPLWVDFPDISPHLWLSLGGLAQVDLNGQEDERLHTQYLEALLGVELAGSLRVNLGGAGCRMDFEQDGPTRSLAGALDVEWDVPGSLTDMFSAGLRWGSGAVDSDTGPYTPVSTIAQGRIFDYGLQGLMNARARYTVRAHESMSVSVEGIFFWRSDVKTFQDSELDGASKDRFLGSEIYGSLIWSPDSALRLSAGGGVFLPGGAFLDDARPRWELRTGLAVSL